MAIPQNFPFAHSGNVELYDEYGSATIANGANADLIDFTIPTNVGKAWITVFGHGIDLLSVFSGSIWQFRVNGSPFCSCSETRLVFASYDWKLASTVSL